MRPEEILVLLTGAFVNDLHRHHVFGYLLLFEIYVHSLTELISLLIFRKDAERLGNELSLQRMKSLSESQRALELERKLFSSERLLKQVTRFFF